MKKKIVSFASILFLIFVVCSCQFSRKGNINNIIQEWHGKEIVIPTDVVFKILGRDTLCASLWDASYKIFTNADSVGCSSCQLGLPLWKAFIDSCRLQKIDIEFIFAVHSSNFKRFDGEVRIYDFDHPIIYDYKDSFDKLNHFPPAPYRTFLLDKDNKVLLIGSPINNPKMWELYQKVITQSQ